MNRRLVVRIVTAFLAVAMLAVPASALAGKNGGGKKKDKALVVCKHGCKYRTIQKAVDKAGQEERRRSRSSPASTSRASVLGKKYKGLTIKGTKKNASKTILEGKNAKLPGGSARQQRDRDRRRQRRDGQEHVGPQLRDQRRLLARHQHRRRKATCQNDIAKNVDVSFNRSYGLFMFGCEGGSFNKSEGWGHGDSAYYVGATPFQDEPKKTVLKNPTPTRTCSATPARTRSTW